MCCRVLEHAASNPDEPCGTGTTAIDLDNTTTAHVGREDKYPSLGWEKLESDARLKCPTFTMTTVDRYFVERKDEDGLPSENYKSLVGDNKARRLFRKGHVQNIEIATRGTEIFFSAQCIPEMKSDKPYFLRLAVSSDGTGNVVDVLHAECRRCPAGKGPFASCKHVAALFYSLEDFCLLGYNTKEDVACTDELQTCQRCSSFIATLYCHTYHLLINSVCVRASLSLSLSLSLSFSLFFLALTIGHYILFENACELQRVVFHLEELSLSELIFCVHLLKYCIFFFFFFCSVMLPS